MTKRSLLIAIAFGLALGDACADVPTTIHHQGRIAVDGVNFNGSGRFKFMLYHSKDGADLVTPVWKNDDAAPTNLLAPSATVSIPVTKGLYSLLLGGESQVPLPASIVPTSPDNLWLRIWFSDGVNGFQLLTPDRQIGAVAFARRAIVADGAGELVFDPPRTFTKRIGASSFLPEDGSASYTRSAATETVTSSGAVTFSAPIELPPGATITKLTMVVDSAAGSVTMGHTQFSEPGIGTTTLLINNGIIPPHFVADQFEFPISPHVTDPDSFYFLRFDSTGSFYGALVEYTLDTFTP